MSGCAATAAANAITNVKSAITSRIRRGTAKPTTTVPSVAAVTVVPQLAPQAVVASTSHHQPRLLRAIAGERALGDDRYNASLFKVENKITAMKKNSIVKIITSKIPMNESTFLTKVKITLCNLLEQHRNTKDSLKLVCLMARTDMATGEEHEEKEIFWSDVHENYPATDLYNMCNTMKETVLDEFAEYLNNGSSWRFKEVKCLEVYIDKNVSLRGSSYKVLPKFIQDKKVVINIKNDDNECFRWSLLRAVNPVNKNAERISDLKSKISTLSWGNMTFPVKLKDIDKFEKLNPNYAVNMFRFEH
jgi:hypothetical protein